MADDIALVELNAQRDAPAGGVHTQACLPQSRLSRISLACCGLGLLGLVFALEVSSRGPAGYGACFNLLQHFNDTLEAPWNPLVGEVDDAMVEHFCGSPQFGGR